MAEYALVTAVVASLAVAFGSLTGSQLSQLPVTAARAQALVVKSAKANAVPAATARATLGRAPYQRPALRYLYASVARAVAVGTEFAFAVCTTRVCARAAVTGSCETCEPVREPNATERLATTAVTSAYSAMPG